MKYISILLLFLFSFVVFSQPQTPISLGDESRFGIELNLEKHLWNYITAKVGCPAEAHHIDECTLTPEILYKEYFQARNLAKKVFDLRDKEE